MCGLFSAELESQSGSERVEARSDQTPEFRLFESACFPDYPSSDLPQTRLAEVMHRMEHHPKEVVRKMLLQTGVELWCHLSKPLMVGLR